MGTVLRGLCVSSALMLSVASAFADDGGGNFALAFKGDLDALAATSPGSPVTLQIDNLGMEALVNWGGPPSKSGVLVYNGHGCCSGWGILWLGADAGGDANKLAVLAGGIVVATSNLTLPVGQWARVTMERVNQVVTLTVGGTGKHDPVQTFNFGPIPVNPLGVDNRPVAGGTVRTTEKAQVGEKFNGLIADVKFRALDTKKNIETWRFNDVAGFITTGKNGAVLNLEDAAFIHVGEDDGDDD
jgi:hypothetical protein